MLAVDVDEAVKQVAIGELLAVHGNDDIVCNEDPVFNKLVGSIVKIEHCSVHDFGRVAIEPNVMSFFVLTD